jgi:hypothetical protein
MEGARIWEKEDIFDDEMVEESLEELNHVRSRYLPSENGIWMSEDEGPEMQNLILRTNPGVSPSAHQLIEAIHLEGVKELDCIEISALNWNSFHAAAAGISSALGSDKWTREDLDENEAARLFTVPLLIIRDIDEKSALAVDVFIHIFWTSKQLQRQEMEDNIEHFLEKNPHFTGELDISNFQPPPSYLVLVGYPRDCFSCSFGEEDESLVIIPQIEFSNEIC